MKIPFVDLKAQYHAIRSEIDDAISQVIQNSAFIGGKYLKAFEQHYAEYLGVKHCIGVGNGTDAISIVLFALGIGQGDEVITAANSFIASSEAITQVGARVVFVDCCAGNYLIDPVKIEEKITANTKAIMPVHLYGQPADMDAIRALAEKYGLRIIEDAAQAHGAYYKGKRAGTLGDCATFSFYPGKNLGAYGDGGAVVTDDDDVARKARMYANHGRVEKYNHEFEGMNSRLDGLQAAILDVKLRHLDAWNARRQTVARMYDEGLQGVVPTPERLPDVEPVYHLYVVRVPEREKVRDALSQRGISTGIHYPIPLPFLNAYTYLGHELADFPVSAEYQSQLLSLPMYGDMMDEQVEYVIQQLREVISAL